MGEALLQNRTLLGLHLMGNDGATVDEMGFVSAGAKEWDLAESLLFSRIPCKHYYFQTSDND